MDNLDGFQKLVSMSLAKTVLFGRDRDLSRLVEIFVIISDFCGFLNFFLDLVYILCFKIGFKMGKKCGKFKFFSKNLDKNLDYLEKAWLSRFISIVSISLDDLDKNLDTAKSRLKSLDFKNLDQEKKILVST